jgi:hypothetical protein
MKNFVRLFLIGSSFLPFSEYSYAWGERGHDLVSRIAARLLTLSDTTDNPIGETFVAKEHMLGHLSNVPDIVWRSMGQAIEAKNGPTHYVDVEYITLNPTAVNLPKDKAELESAMKKLCTEKPKGYKCADEKGTEPKAELAGTAQFRIHQIATLMQESFQKAADEQKKSSQVEGQIKKHLDDALYYAGILSHFVGDLANPYHTSRDYNGYEINQGGVHSYFESDTVNTFDLGFDMDVYNRAVELRDLTTLRKFAKDTKSLDYLDIAYAQIKESFSNLKLVQELDLKYAVTKLGNSDKGLKIKAERKPADQIAVYFRPIIRDRMAQGAATLAHLWRQAWTNGGKPNLSAYRSYDYRTTPDFIAPNF